MKNKTAFTILTILVLSFLLYLSGGIFVHHGSAKNSESIAADVDLLKQMEAKTPTDFSSRKIEIEQNRCAMACQGCGAVFYS